MIDSMTRMAARVMALEAKLRELAAECAECGGTGRIYRRWTDLCDAHMFGGESPSYESWKACNGIYDCEACADIRTLLQPVPPETAHRAHE